MSDYGVTLSIETAMTWADVTERVTAERDELAKKVVAVLELHRRMPILTVESDDCNDHDQDEWAVELDVTTLMCGHPSHVTEWTCAECYHEGADEDYPQWPCATARALGVGEEASE